MDINELRIKLQDEEDTELPEAIFQDLETTSKTTMEKNLKRFTKDIKSYTGGKWTQSGAINKEFIPELKKRSIDVHTAIQARYKDADKLRQAARAATEIYEDLQAHHQQRRKLFEKLFDYQQQFATLTSKKTKKKTWPSLQKLSKKSSMQGTKSQLKGKPQVDIDLMDLDKDSTTTEASLSTGVRENLFSGETITILSRPKDSNTDPDQSTNQ
ncbi:hypothetical protein O0I10_010072 [Lichtheimia ornata]|uniref:Uncharacterized protein n=1 Tax=Lichtheimia ornata TaxID=688661 RepID=A0AAD7UVW8_9FUNG|nr:uncharacterized protein O0I10_010072 [Lichtheimia ornata]KAJ8654250.1 hypothetical protein O0I10_010072 [Lichtheimia ornata]